MLLIDLFETIDIIPTRNQIQQTLKSVQDKLLSVAIRYQDDPEDGYDAFLSILHNAFKDDDIYFKFADNSEKSETWWWEYVAHAGAYFDYSILITLSPYRAFNAKSSISLINDPELYIDLLSSTILHEFMHLYQIHKSDKKMKVLYHKHGKQSADGIDNFYLKDKHELHAQAKDFAESIFILFNRYRGKKTSIIDFIKRNFKHLKEDSGILMSYYQHFGKHINDPEKQKVWNLFLKRVIEYTKQFENEYIIKT